jgi:hypothetical protein
MNRHRNIVRSVLSWKLLAAAGLLVVTGCQLATGPLGATTSGETGQVQTFVADFIRQALAAFVL